MYVLIKVGLENYRFHIEFRNNDNAYYSCTLVMWVTVTGHAACTYEKILIMVIFFSPAQYPYNKHR